MKVKIMYLSLIILTMVILLSCRSALLSYPAVSSQSFPNQVGDSWTYTVTSMVSDTPKSSSVKISVINKTHLPDGTPIMIWINQWPENDHPAGFKSGRDTAYVVTSGDTIKISSSIYPVRYPPKTVKDLSIAFKYVLPMDIGHTWENGVDSTLVVSKDTLTVPAGTFDNVYHLKTWGSGHNYAYGANIWFKPGVGILKVIQASPLGLTMYGFSYTWKLTGYHLK